MDLAGPSGVSKQGMAGTNRFWWPLVVAILAAFAPLRSFASEPAAARPNVVLIVVDTLRADRFEALLETRLPYLRGLAARSTRFSNVSACSSWTPTATASIFTGLHPHQHGVRSGYLALEGGKRLVPVDRISERLTTLPMVMAAAGYRTLGVSDNVNIGETMGFARGFDRFRQYAYVGAARITATARRLWQRRRRDDRRPTFLYLHLMDPHAPYHRRAGHVAPSPQAGEVAEDLARYDSELVYLDGQLGKLAAKLAWDRDTLVVFTSDHGEAFGEHGQHGHPNQLYQELLSVPLMISKPGQRTSLRVDEPVSGIDILPTLRGLLGLGSDDLDAGLDLRPAMAGSVLPARGLLAMRFGDFLQPPLARRALIDAGFKYIVSAPSGRVELYDLGADPGESHDLSRVRPALTGKFAARLRAMEAGPRPYVATRIAVEASADGGASLAQRLRALGYAD